MRKSTVIRLLALALMLTLVPLLPALADICALCSKEAGSSSYICAACMLDLMEEKDLTGGLSVTGCRKNADGTVTLTWSDSAANGPYGVHYELLTPAPTPFGWTAVQKTHATSHTLTQLAPGVSYVFTVTDASGNRVQHTYAPARLREGNEIAASIEAYPLLMGTGWASPLSAAEIMEGVRSHGLHVQLTYAMLRYTRNYAFTVTVESPNGFTDVVLSGSLTLNAGRSDVPAWDFIPLDEYFTTLARHYGGVPAGAYRVTLNFDGKPACSASFAVKE